jgi:ABC-type transport system involved in multi-copper enzyme maturation permease subunit
MAVTTTSMLRVTVLFDVRRLLFSRAGTVYIAGFAFLWYLLLSLAVVNYANLAAGQGSASTAWSSAALDLYLRIALFVFPLLSVFIAANQTASDRVRGTLRFILLRCSRDTVYWGRFLAQLLIHWALIVCTFIAMLMMAIYHDGLQAAFLFDALHILLNLCLCIVPFIALMSVLSVLIDSPRKASFLALLIWTLAAALIRGLASYFPAVSSLEILVPGMQFSDLTQLPAAQMLYLAYIPLLQAFVLLVLGRFMMQGRAV